MPRRHNRISDTEFQRRVERRLEHEAYVHDLAEGRRQRAVTFTPSKGKGSYTRRTKHRPDFINA
jgi:hypothetical protein